MLGWRLLHTGSSEAPTQKVLMASGCVVKRPLPKKCNIKGLTMKVAGPTKTLYILNAEVVLMTVWGGVSLDLWANYELS